MSTMGAGAGAEWEEERRARWTTRAVTVAALAPLLLLLPAQLLARAAALLLLGLLLTGRRPYWLYVTYRTLRRDLRLIVGKTLVTLRINGWAKRELTVRKRLRELTRLHPDKVAYHTEERAWTYAELSALSDSIAAAMLRLGVARGRCVALLLGSAGARLPAAWLGMAALGAPAALLPPSARGPALLHALRAAKATVLLYSHSASAAVRDILPELGDVVLVQWDLPGAPPGLLPGATALGPLLDGPLPGVDLAERIDEGRFRDSLIYIYTSGTTGLPKAAIVTNSRYLLVTQAASEMSRLTGADVLYSAMPLHHTAGGVLGAGQALVNGVTVVIRDKFSATHFWTDCIKYRCTSAQYIGEMCRFLLTAQQLRGGEPPAHSLRLMIGNGLRAALWTPFKDTFRIPEIYEFYGATEGNTNMINITSQPGAVGFIPRLLTFLAPLTLVKCDEVTGELIRDSEGLCIQCKPCEEGLLLGSLDHQEVMYSYSGYVDKAATNRKLLRDVLRKGDCYFNSGDLLVMDHMGNFYFRDRTGDTFRWRGENVSTTEVEGIISSVTGVDYVMVYGVEIPGVEGRAGMAALVASEPPPTLPRLGTALAPYARPLFLRLLTSPPLTATHKLVKTALKDEAYNLHRIKDPLLFLDQCSGEYVSLTEGLYNDITSGKVRL